MGPTRAGEHRPGGAHIPADGGHDQDFLRRQILDALDSFRDDLHRSRPDTPQGDLQCILSAIHWPEIIGTAHGSRLELAGDEVLEIQLALLDRRRHREQSTVRCGFAVDPAVRSGLTGWLPFHPADIQQRGQDKEMSRQI